MLNIVFIGLAISSSWGNGHATTYRSLLKGLKRRGHHLTFLERDQPWYASHRDARRLDYCELGLYVNERDLRDRFASLIRHADAVVVGSYVADGRSIIRWMLQEAKGVRAFYDIDTPITLAALSEDACDYVAREQIAEFDLLLSFTGGPTLSRLESQFGARLAAPLYCSVDPEQYGDIGIERDIDLGYMGTYSADRQAGLECFLTGVAGCLDRQRFAVAGAQYPPQLVWPDNVTRIEHLGPQQHARFYSRQRFTLNLTRAHMREAGYSPSVRMFEAAACGTPLISDDWAGLGHFFEESEEILIARRTSDVVGWLCDYGDVQRRQLAAAARERVLSAHTGERRAEELEDWLARAANHAGSVERAKGTGALLTSEVAG
jgi:spore maturation protein CgeB